MAEIQPFCYFFDQVLDELEKQFIWIWPTIIGLDGQPDVKTDRQRGRNEKKHRIKMCKNKSVLLTFSWCLTDK